MKRSPLRRVRLVRRLRAVSKKMVSLRALKKLAREVVVELRDQHQCQRCPNSGHDFQHRDRNGKIVAGPPEIHWAHVLAGRAKTLMLKPWAAMALCAGCHFWYDANGGGAMGSKSREWWASKFPEREILLRTWELDRRRPKFNAELER